VPVAKATVYDGTFTVYGAHPLKWKEGRYQYSYFEDKEDDLEIAKTVGLPRLGDDTYKLEFVGGKSHY
jgi:hypothetical protein